MASVRKRPGRPKSDPRYDVRYRDASYRVRTRTFSRKIDAESFADNVETDLDRGEWTDPRLGRITFSEYAECWLAGRHGLRPLTADDYRSILDRHLAPAFGAVQLARLTTEQIRVWHAETHRRTPSRAAKSYRLLRAILNTATDDGIIARSPCRIAGAGQERATERPFLTAEQVATVIEASPECLRALAVLAAACGLRLGELLALRRRHVDLLHGTVAIKEQCFERADGTVEFGPPKSDAGRRRVAIPSSVVPILEKHLAMHVAGTGPDAFLFAGRTGEPLRRRRFYATWGATRRAAGLPTLHLHDLRHYGATLTAQAGATTKELMARLGHASPRASLIYQHAAAERDRELAERVGAVFDAATPARDTAVAGLSVAD